MGFYQWLGLLQVLIPLLLQVSNQADLETTEEVIKEMLRLHNYYRSTVELPAANMHPLVRSSSPGEGGN